MKPRPRPVPATGLIALVLSCAAISSSGAAAKPRSAAPLYWGATIGSQLTGAIAPYDMKPVAKFARIAGKGLSIVGFSGPFTDCTSSPCIPYNFPDTAMENVRKYGAIPFFSWGSQSDPGSVNEPNYQLSDVINGRYDSYIRSFAQGAKRWGHPFF